MELDEIVRLIKGINIAFPNAKDIVPDRAGVVLQVWGEDLGDLSARDVWDAFADVRASGAEFPPTSGKLRAAVLERRNPLPRFDQVIEVIERAIRNYGTYRSDEAMAFLEKTVGAPELVRGMGGWAAICNGGPVGQDSVDSGVWRSQQEHAWKEIAHSIKVDRARGAPALPAVPLKVLPESSRVVEGCPLPTLPQEVRQAAATAVQP
jgi:hypothetical protein